MIGWIRRADMRRERTYVMKRSGLEVLAIATSEEPEEREGNRDKEGRAGVMDRRRVKSDGTASEFARESGRNDERSRLSVE